jgi:hypothetical protein
MEIILYDIYLRFWVNCHLLYFKIIDADVRQTFYNVYNFYDLLTNVAGDTILKFLEVINLYSKI